MNWEAPALDVKHISPATAMSVARACRPVHRAHNSWFVTGAIEPMSHTLSLSTTEEDCSFRNETWDNGWRIGRT